MANKYDELVQQIISYAGGEDNISRVTHCATRLRFNLKDNGLANLEEIKKLKVFGAQFSGGQLQVIIGNDVNVVYDEIVNKLGLEAEKAVDENLDGNLSEKKPMTVKGVVSAVIDTIVASIVPIVSVLCGSGLIKALIMIAQQLGVSADSPTIVVLSFAADAAFYFAPILIGYHAAKRFNADPVMGMAIGAILLHPTFVSLVNEGAKLSVFGIPVYSTTYSSTVIPIILSVWIMSYVQKIVRKIVPSVLRIILEPTLVMLIMIPLTLCALAPLGAILSNGFATVLLAFHSAVGPLAVAVLCAIIPFVVMTGLHLGLIPVMIQSIMSVGRDSFIHPSLMISNFAQGAACLAVGLKTKDKERKALALSCSFSNIVPGISEPGMYGVTLRYKTPMIAAMIGCFAGGLYAGITNVAALQFAPPSIFSLALYASDKPSTLVNMVVAVVIAMAVTFAVCMFIYKDEEK